MSASYVLRDQIPLSTTAPFDECQLLQDVYPLVKTFRGKLQAGNTHDFSPLDGHCFCVYCFTEGIGKVETNGQSFIVNGLCFFVSEPSKPFILSATETIEYTRFLVTMLESDLREWNETHCVLPCFKTISQCEPYWQSCKSVNTQSWYVLCRKLLPRTIMGVCRAQGPGREGTREDGHPNVAQWNVMLPGSDIELTVHGETIPHKYGDFSFVPAGEAHSLISLPGKLNYYIWFEHFVRELETVSWQP